MERLVPEHLNPSPSFAVTFCVILGKSLNLWDKGSQFSHLSNENILSPTLLMGFCDDSADDASGNRFGKKEIYSIQGKLC